MFYTYFILVLTINIKGKWYQEMNNDYCATNDKILNKWKLTGLLQNLSEEVNEESGLSEQMECAVLLENTATALSGMASEDNVFNKKC